jgi:hypothetical protein
MMGIVRQETRGSTGFVHLETVSEDQLQEKGDYFVIHRSIFSLKISRAYQVDYFVAVNYRIIAQTAQIRLEPKPRNLYHFQPGNKPSDSLGNSRPICYQLPCSDTAYVNFRSIMVCHH